MSSEDLRDLITSGKKTKFAKAMAEILEEKINNLPEFYEFYGELIKDHPNFILGFSYMIFRKYAQRMLSLEQLLLMDKVLMQNYALSKHEPIRFCFSGAVIRRAATVGISINGIVYITDLRIIGIGSIIKRRPDPITHIASVVAPPASGALDKTFRAKMKETLGEDFTESEFTKFDNIFPINNIYDIKRKKKYIGYTTDIEFDKKDKTKKKKLIMLLVAGKEKKEDNVAFEKRKEELYDKIESFLISCQ
ncbi:MAG: hypothetical protein ACFFD2_25115 [Promethearchaeota archaeon]